ncbi:MAG TPA: hypothetical protein DDW65_09555 [Firmicutes bacterium]|jgi:hypothetical protein|nr:hypothetical protein [Bacillota bacterium]
MLYPDGVIFEMEHHQSEPLVAGFIFALPMVRFIGIHPNGERMTVFSATGSHLAAVEELEEVILERGREDNLPQTPL